MYQRILVPIDTSPASAAALVEACALAKTLQATVRLLHVVELDQFGWGRAQILDESAHQSIKDTGDLVLNQALAQAHQAGISAESHAIHGWLEGLPDLLLAEARLWEADLIVMGTHGRSGLRHLMVGSVAEGVLRGTEVPLLLIRRAE
jgi:nucleotide-binding universal stress UspA family protein